MRIEPKKLCLGKRADGCFSVAATLVYRVPLPPQAILAFFADVAVKANNPYFG
jgi:hypothetical protein